MTGFKNISSVMLLKRRNKDMILQRYIIITHSRCMLAIWIKMLQEIKGGLLNVKINYCRFYVMISIRKDGHI